ncbi:hypothetical protein MMC29_008211, partial [Sticta canariensis]|nr:hypothetical protein [Sticta canariensis]
MALFRSPEAMLKWIRICGSDKLANRADFGNQPSDMRTSIYYAALLGPPEVVIRLVDDGARIKETFDECYGTPLVAASCLARKEAVTILLENGADPNLSAFWLWGCPVVRLQPENEITETAEESNTEYREMISSESMIYIAATYSSQAVLEVLLEAGADPNIEGGEYDSALQPGCYLAPLRRQKKPIAAGSDINHTDGTLVCALYAACQEQDEEIVVLLLEKGANVNVHDDASTYNDSLQAACSSGNSGIVEELLVTGSDVNRKGEDL